MIQYKLPEEILPELPIDEQLKDLMELKGVFKDMGISISNTRIDRYYIFLEFILNNSVDTFVSNNDINPCKFFPNSENTIFKSNADWILYIIREIHELLWIVKGFKKYKPKGLDVKLKKIISGADFAVFDTNDMSRNLQYELRIASYFCQIGWEVDLSTLTDIVVNTKKFYLFIECKRAGKKFISRIKEAHKQINKRVPKIKNNKPCYSLICIDVTQKAFPHNGLVCGSTAELTKYFIQKK